MLISDYKPFKKKKLDFFVCETFNRINKQEGKKKRKKNRAEKVETK